MKKTLALLGLALSLVLMACSAMPSKESNTDKLQVVVTNSILADMTKEVAGDLVNLHSIVPIGQDPHEYEPLAADIQRTTEADVIFYNGLNLETGGDAWFTKLIKTTKKVADEDYFAVSDGVQVIYLEGKAQAGKEDPHAWLSLDNGIIYATNIAKTLMAKDPANKETYQKNLDTYVAKLSQLHDQAKQAFDGIPEEKKLIVTSEGAFKYFSQAYGVPSAYIWEINTEEEGTPEQLSRLVEQLRASQVPALFIESSVDRRPMETVSRDTGLPIAAELFTDSIAPAGQAGDSYYAMMAWNLEKISEGLAK